MPKARRVSQDEVEIGGKTYKLGKENFPGGRPILFDPPRTPPSDLIGKTIQIVIEEGAIEPPPVFPPAVVTHFVINEERRPLFVAKLSETPPDSSLRQVLFQSVSRGWEPQLLVNTSSEGIMRELRIPIVFLGVIPDRPLADSQLRSIPDLEFIVRVDPSLLSVHGLVNVGFGEMHILKV